MLYMHCGFVRTGTTSLQSAIVAHRKELERVGILYPDQWRRPNGVNHHLVLETLRERDGALRLAKQTQEDLRLLPGGRVLLSAEGLSGWTQNRSQVDALLAFLLGARRTMPVRCVWTLRNLVEVLASLYVGQKLANLPNPPTPARFMLDVVTRALDGMCGLKRLEDSVENAYFKYERDGSHQVAILKEIGVPTELHDRIVQHLRGEPRLNVRLTHKGAVVMLHYKELGSRVGFPFSKRALGKLFFSDRFRFTDDGPCRLFDPDLLGSMHEEALATARGCGFMPYVDFFEDDRIDEDPPLPTDPDILSDEDLERLIAQLRQGGGADGELHTSRLPLTG